jgi:hypothetical protein
VTAALEESFAAVDASHDESFNAERKNTFDDLSVQETWISAAAASSNPPPQIAGDVSSSSSSSEEEKLEGDSKSSLVDTLISTRSPEPPAITQVDD